MYFENDSDQLVGNTNEYRRNYNKWQIEQRLEEQTAIMQDRKDDRLSRLRRGVAKMNMSATMRRLKTINKK